MTAAAGNRRIWPQAVAALVVFAILCSLGFWQVRRLAWKEALVASIDARMQAAPRPLDAVAADFAATGDVDYMPVTVRGMFDHAHEQFFFATHDGASGYFVYTPLKLADGRSVLVNRGFVPWEMKDPAKRPEGENSGEVIVEGLARNPLPAKPSWVVPDNDPVKNIYYWKDIALMAGQAGLEPGRGLVPFFIDAGSAPNPGGFPVGGVTQVELPNNHLQYAVTWFGLAAALAAVFGVWAFRRRR